MRKVLITAASGFLIALTLVLFSCASVEKGAKKDQGVTGTVVFKKAGEETGSPPKSEVRVDCIPVREGTPVAGDTVRLSPSADGTFFGRLEYGEYTIEVFLKGFYVRRMDVAVRRNEVTELGIIELERIETEPGKPVKTGGEQDVVLKEGDVNIEPPSF